MNEGDVLICVDPKDANDIGWCGKCRIKECPYNKDLNKKRKMGWNV